jgi:hypothetical protein
MKCVESANIASQASNNAQNVLGSESIITHLKGLQQMINMKGGINNLPSDQGQRMTEMVILYVHFRHSSDLY